MYIISDDLISQFTRVAVKNTSMEDGQHLETLAFLLGYSEYDNFIATDLIFPKQHGQAHKVDDEGINGEDTLPWSFKTLKLERRKKPLLIAWIHSHVRGSDCGFSSIDNHMQHTLSKVHNGVLGLVIEIKKNGQRGVYDFFEMTQIGKRSVELCSRQKTCITSEQHDSCNRREFYQTAKN